MESVRKPTTSRREKINKQAMNQAKNRLKEGKDKGDLYKNFINKNEDDYASGGTVRLASGGPVVDSYDYS